MKPIPIPQKGWDYWEGTTGVPCPCGGTIRWAEAGFAPGDRACDRCLVLFAVRGEGPDRRLVPQALQVWDGNPIVYDADETVPDRDLYRVSPDYFRSRGWG